MPIKRHRSSTKGARSNRPEKKIKTSAANNKTPATKPYDDSSQSTQSSPFSTVSEKFQARAKEINTFRLRREQARFQERLDHFKLTEKMLRLFDPKPPAAVMQWRSKDWTRADAIFLDGSAESGARAWLAHLHAIEQRTATHGAAAHQGADPQSVAQ